MSDLVVACNCCMARSSRRSRVGVGMNRSATMTAMWKKRGVKMVNRFERSNGLDTASTLYN